MNFTVRTETIAYWLILVKLQKEKYKGICDWHFSTDMEEQAQWGPKCIFWEDTAICYKEWKHQIPRTRINHPRL